MTKFFSLNDFNENEGLFDGQQWMLVIKSQNQIQRRSRMLKSKQANRYGRFVPSATEMGLLAKGVLDKREFRVEWAKPFREPRHIKMLKDGRFLMSEINRLVLLDQGGELLRSYTHPFFGYLHSVDLSLEDKRALTVSSGYDAVIEIDLATGKETFSWFAWDHGYNPDSEGNWLAATKASYDAYLRVGKKAKLIDPNEYGEQGITTANRVAHPNVAVYESMSNTRAILLCIGHDGELLRVSLDDGRKQVLYDGLCIMAHGIFKRYPAGWAITNTTEGKWIWLDDYFREEQVFDLSTLGGKVEDAGDAEWLQQVVALRDNKALGLDANRGLIALDIENMRYALYQANPNWCIQDALFLG